MRIGACVGVGVLIVALAGCAPDSPPVLPPETPAVEPMFASDEEALAAAEEAYAAYLAMSDRIGQAGWLDASDLEAHSRASALEDEIETSRTFSERGLVQVGSSKFDSIALQQYLDEGPGTVVLTVYLCLDVQGVDIVDGSGKSIISTDRDSRLPLEVELDDADGSIKVSRSELWPGQDFC